jgi:hypothetical protein
MRTTLKELWLRNGKQQRQILLGDEAGPTVAGSVYASQFFLKIHDLFDLNRGKLRVHG